MANRIEDGDIYYNSTKYTIIFENDEFYIAFAVNRSGRSVTIKATKDLSVVLSNSSPDPMILTKAIIGKDGSVVCLGFTYESIFPDKFSTISYTRNSAVICKYDKDMNLLPYGSQYNFVQHFPVVDGNSSFFIDIAEVDDGYLVIGHEFEPKNNALVFDYIIKGFTTLFDESGCVCRYNPTEDVAGKFTSRSHNRKIIITNDWYYVISRESFITMNGKVHSIGTGILRYSKDFNDIQSKIICDLECEDITINGEYDINISGLLHETYSEHDGSSLTILRHLPPKKISMKLDKSFEIYIIK